LNISENLVRFKTADDVELEGLYCPCSGASRIAVICHPHPQYGGEMNNNVVQALRDFFCARNVATLRFNFRSVGNSGGQHSDGRYEPLDVDAALAWAAKKAQDKTSLILAGYSFGAWAAARSSYGPVELLLLVAPPAGFMNFDLPLRAAGKLLTVRAPQDQFSDAESVRRALATFKGESTLIELDRGDHFFFGEENKLQQTLAEQLDSMLGNG
jgi:uncharacterized protein